MTTEFHRVTTCHLISISSFSALPISPLPRFFVLCLSGNSAQGEKFRMTFQPEGLIWKMLTSRHAASFETTRNQSGVQGLFCGITFSK